MPATERRPGTEPLPWWCLAGIGVLAVAGVIGLTIRPANAATRIKTLTVSPTGWTDGYCTTCHTTDALFSHPVGVIPSLRVPNSLPLTDGRLTCTTCHDDSVDAHAQARLTGGSLLRNSTGAANFCTQCHDGSKLDRANQHGAGIRRAHLAWPGKPIAGTVSASGLDSITQSCLTCHDGVTAGQISAESGTGQGNHPVGNLYPANTMAEGEGQLRARDALDARIHLVNDQIGCVTCHSPFSAENKLVVMSNQGSRLCLSCHQMN